MRHPVRRKGSLGRVLLCVSMMALATDARAAANVTLFRLFLLDGSAVVSYGEFAHVDDRVIFSMPVGNTEDPVLHVVTLPASLVDWRRTDHYARSVRYQHYADTRGEADFENLNSEVAAALNQIAMTTDRRRALEIAEQARRTLAAWPRAHYGYRQQDVREIITLLDESISDLRAAAGASSFDLTFEAFVDVDLESVLGMPSLREQVDQIFVVASHTGRSSDRLALLQAALALIKAPESAIVPRDAATLRKSAEQKIKLELVADAKYTELSKRLLADATRAADRGQVSEVERVLDRISGEDSRLGGSRPEMVDAVRASVRAQLETARHLRLLRDQWAVRRKVYRQYQRTIGSWMFQLAKTRSSLEAIRRLDGPSAGSLQTLQKRFDGGAEQLQKLTIPPPWRTTHDLVVSAWRFAENAIRTRHEAVTSGSVATAWEASSAAAGALLMLSRAEQEIRTLLDPPRLQ
jgi:hypothetical protein